jgi:hypothetical protein
MSWHKTLALGAFVAIPLVSAALAAEFGRPPTADEIKAWDIDVLPDGTGLPPGRARWRAARRSIKPTARPVTEPMGRAASRIAWSAAKA